jgi:hypothetical protein
LKEREKEGQKGRDGDEEDVSSYWIILKQRKDTNWIGHILRRNHLLQHIIEEKIEHMLAVTGRRGRRRKQLLDDLKTKKG